ncbi:MFS transporter [Acidipropionibacterium jensenii]|uniref:MFS transporter n=1 Tax=Acidipropionibacterium jensenii TaxID=1749 RepID=UPI002649C2F5|nr:MFS transporter [Acidipropionibacterium jensenii]MDN5978226.1 MFS transporter [Acidipropionibacterium jensenii]MDN6426318.1 MFS transporter [Acidipropionibacterium jensenii]MDN6480641.1 MFS transporter [Acidipropionibacterium jensenii]MDN6513353.1 MFS transporter [Acidipropionibacterium jensenii]MDN6592610.1 MFS transporter [Acidipropionibacterium jensenii]
MTNATPSAPPSASSTGADTAASVPTAGIGVITGRPAVRLVAALITAVVAYQLNATMVAPTLPDIARTFSASTTQIAQVSSLFSLAGSVAGVVATRWSDFLGRRRMLMIVLTIAAIGSVVALFSPNLPVPLGARVLQGIACGSFQITFVVLGARLQPKTFAMGVTMPRHEVGLIEGRMDWWGAALMTVVLIALTKLVAHGSAQGWGAETTLIYIAIFVVSAVAFTLVERRRHDPLINPAHLVSRQIWPLLATTILFTVAFSAVIYFTFVLFAQTPRWATACRPRSPRCATSHRPRPSPPSPPRSPVGSPGGSAGPSPCGSA